jgi:ABC-2 type transport system ATP-binding protein
VTVPIEARGLHKAYGERHVLRGIELEVRHGEVLALLGPNGAGKTTTLEILEGYRTASAGLVRVLGHDPASRSPELRARVGVVLQECGFPDHLRVSELLDAWRGYYPRPRPLDELLDLVELRDDRATLVRRLSGGQRRRLDFALALAGDPEVIFLDEPTTGFDPEARRRCWAVIENLRSLNKTILLTTHYLDEAERLADRIAILTDGRIGAVGSARELARATHTPATISFTAADGRVVVHTDDPAATLRQLLGERDELQDLAVVPPSLEDVYLQLVSAPERVAS